MFIINYLIIIEIIFMVGAVIPRGYPVLDKQNGVKNSNQMSIT